MKKIISLEITCKCPVEVDFYTDAECYDDLTDSEVYELLETALNNYNLSLEYDYTIDEDSLEFEEVEED